MDHRDIIKRLQVLDRADDDLLEDIYVERPASAKPTLGKLSRFSRVLVYGQHGSGKTTELQQLTRTLSGHQAVWIDTPAIGISRLPPELSFLVILAEGCFNALPGKGVWPMRKRISSLGRALGLDFRVGNLERTLTEASEPTSERSLAGALVSIVHDLVITIEKHSGKQTIIVADDIEKLSNKIQWDLLSGMNVILKMVPCPLVLTASAQVVFDAELWWGIRDRFQTIDLSNVPVVTMEGKTIRKNIDFFLTLLGRRLGLRRIPDGAHDNPVLALLIAASGGNLRQFFRLVSDAYLSAMDKGYRRQIDDESAREAVLRGEHEFRRVLSLRDRDDLRRVAKTHEFDRSYSPNLVTSLAVLLYRHKSKVWAAVNPLAREMAGQPTIRTSRGRDAGSR